MTHTIFLILLLFSFSAQAAGSIKETVSNLKVVKLHYGINNFNIGKNTIVITKAKILKGNAWDYDNYIAMREKLNEWQIIQNEKGEFLYISIPHTGEDVVSSIYFMTPKNDNKLRNLYLLTAIRKYKIHPLESVAVEFSLFVMENSADDVFYFTLLKRTMSEKKYCNSDVAISEELVIDSGDEVGYGGCY